MRSERRSSMRSSVEALGSQHVATRSLELAEHRLERRRRHRQDQPLRTLVDVDDVGHGRAERRPDRRDVRAAGITRRFMPTLRATAEAWTGPMPP